MGEGGHLSLLPVPPPARRDYTQNLAHGVSSYHLRCTSTETPRAMARSATKVKRTRLMVADDHQTVLDTVAAMLAPEFEIVGTAQDGGALLEAVVRLDPDLVVLDISMPVYNGLEVARRLRRRGSRAKVVFLTVHDDEDFVHEALAAGATAYVIKASMAVDLTRAIHEALAGRTFISPSIAMTDSENRRHES